MTNLRTEQNEALNRAQEELEQHQNQLEAQLAPYAKNLKMAGSEVFEKIAQLKLYVEQDLENNLNKKLAIAQR